MGRIFTAEAVAHHHIPEPGAHQEAGRFILDQLFEPRDEWTNEEKFAFIIDGNGVESGLVYGSTALGSAGLRSDVDILLNYHASYANTVFPLIRDLFETAERTYNVPVEANVLPVGALYSPLEHSIDPLFAQHLLTVQYLEEPRWSYNWPVDAIQFTPLGEDLEQLRAIAIRYASGKSRQFTRALINFRGEADLLVMQRALELPGAIGRKVIAATQEHGDEDLDLGDKHVLSDVTLERLTQLSQGWFTQATLYHQYLFNLDKTYNQILQSAIEGDTAVEDYTEWIQENYLHACKMAQEVAYAWSQIIGRRLDIPLDGLDAALPYELADDYIY